MDPPQALYKKERMNNSNNNRGAARGTRKDPEDDGTVTSVTWFKREVGTGNACADGLNDGTTGTGLAYHPPIPSLEPSPLFGTPSSLFGTGKEKEEEEERQRRRQ